MNYDEIKYVVVVVVVVVVVWHSLRCSNDRPSLNAKCNAFSFQSTLFFSGALFALVNNITEVTYQQTGKQLKICKTSHLHVSRVSEELTVNFSLVTHASKT